MNQAIKQCKVHQFAYDANLSYTNRFIKKLNKFLNKDLKKLTNLLNANKMLSCWQKMRTKKPLDCQLKLKLNRKRLHQTS